MSANLRFASAVIALVLAGSALATVDAAAITADVAKKCREQAIKAYPPQPAGSTKGTAEAERDFYRKCVENGGKVEK